MEIIQAILNFLTSLFGSAHANPTPKLSREEFRATISRVLGALNLGGMDPKLLLAVAMHETGWGIETGIFEHHNVFNIHAVGAPNPYWDGSSYYVKSTDTVRRYNNWDNAVLDFVRLMQTERYRASYALARSKTTAFFYQLQKDGYNGEADYGDRVLRNFNAL